MVTTAKRWRIEDKRRGRRTVVAFATDYQVNVWRRRGFDVVEIPLPEPENCDDTGGAR